MPRWAANRMSDHYLVEARVKICFWKKGNDKSGKRMVKVSLEKRLV